jgi:hypothetical protein
LSEQVSACTKASPAGPIGAEKRPLEEIDRAGAINEPDLGDERYVAPLVHRDILEGIEETIVQGRSPTTSPPALKKTIDVPAVRPLIVPPNWFFVAV